MALPLQKIEQESSWEAGRLRASDLECLRNAAKAAAAGGSAGLPIVFVGGSSLQRTLAAAALAGEAGLDFYRVDIGRAVSKSIGETERNLDSVLREAAAVRSVLMFDEGDALFGKRTDIKDASDRYANMETGYLLERIEKMRVS